MPIIDINFFGSIDKFIENSKQANSPSILLTPLPKPIEQRGHTCKLYALSMVMEWLFIRDNQSIATMPPPARKSDRKTIEKSLRKEVKSLGSKVGEVYDHRILLQLAKNYGYQDSCVYDCNGDKYNEVLKQELAAGNAPIIFFDVNKNNGHPDMANSLNEHAAVVIGYFTDKLNELCYIIMQWGKYYCVHANDTIMSTNQLVEIREPETFVKIGKDWRQVGDRFDIDNQVNNAVRNDLYKKMVFSNKSESALGTFKNKILVIKSSMHELLNKKRRLNINIQSSEVEETPATKMDDVRIGANFIALDELINFLEIDTIRPTPYSDEQLKYFADHFSFRNEITALTQQQYQTEVEETLDDDIYKQNPHRTRSIIELTSNAIDSGSNKIFVNIVDGEYRVKDFGLGMPPIIIFRKFLPPKATSKEDMQDVIGLFGLGFYTALAHLHHENDYVLVITKAADFPAYKIEFRKLAGKFYVNITSDSLIIENGTDIIVHSSDIKTETYKSSLEDCIKYHEKTPIYINGQLANDFSKSQVYSLSHSKIIINDIENAGVITIAVITIQKFIQETLYNPFLVVIDLPRSVSLSEGRNQARINSALLRQEIRQLIDFGTQLPVKKQVSYFNGIAPIVENLQTYNSSQHKEDNVLLYLQFVAYQLFATRPQIPNKLFYAPLCTNNVISLHPLILANNWANKIGYQPSQWHSESTRIYIVDMQPCAAGIGFLHDRDTETIYLSKADFEKIIKNDDYWKLNLILSHPKNEINGQWLAHSNLGTQKESASALQSLERTVAADKYKTLYQKHGCLRELGDAFIDSLTPQQQAILLQAATLMQAYNLHPRLDEYGREMSEWPITQAVAYTCNRKKYYFIYSERHKQNLLMDEHFQPLYQLHDLILLEKINQLRHEDPYGKKSDNEVVTLSEDDLLMIADRKTHKAYLYNGVGKKILEGSSYYDCIQKLDDNYFIIHNDRHNKPSSILYHKTLGVVPNISGQLRILSTNPVVLEVTKNEEKFMYPVESSKLIRLYDEILINCGELYILLGQGNEFAIYNFAEQCLAKIKKIHPNNVKIKDIHCQLINSALYISIFYLDRTTELLIHNTQVAETNSSLLTYPNQCAHHEIIGYPVKGYISRSGIEQYFHTIKAEQTSLRIDHCQMFENENENATYYLRSCSIDKASTSSIIKHKLFLLTYQKEGIFKKSIINAESNLVDLPPALLNEDIVNITPLYFRHYLLELPNKILVLIDINGKFLAQGKAFEHTFFDFFLVDQQKIINPAGQVIFQDNDIYTIEIQSENKLISVTYRHGKKILIDYNGKFITHYSRCFSSLSSRSEFVIDGVDYIITPHAVIPNATGISGRSRTCFLKHFNNRRTIVNDYGYPVFPKPVQNMATSIAKNIICDYAHSSQKNSILSALSETDFRSETVYSNLAYLNSLNLNPDEFGKCLRFIRLNPNDFQALYPYMQKLKYVPSLEQAAYYLNILKKIVSEPEHHQDIIIKALDLVYIIAGHYSTINMSHKLTGILEIYGVSAIKKLYESLLIKQAELQTNMHGIENAREAINEMPQEVGQFVYYIFFPSANILMSKQEIIAHANFLAPSLKLLDLFTAHRLNKNVTEKAFVKSNFLHTIDQLTQHCHKHHLERKLIHAIYHQAHPEKSLYLREFLQNAIDAYAAHDVHEQRKIPIHIFKNEFGECVLSLEDQGIGMAVTQALKLLPIPGGSSKRENSGKFIGGRGVGLFTAFHGARRLLIKTSTGDGNTHYFLFIPQYIKLHNGELKIVDIDINWQTIDEMFQGTIIQRVSLTEHVELEAAKYHRAIHTHARFIDSNAFEVSINGVIINKPLIPLVNSCIPNFGRVTFLKSNECAFTAGGLFVKNISAELFSDLPDFIKNLLFRHGLVIDLPKNVALNRERNDFETVDKFNAFIKPYLIQNCYAAYISLFSQGLATLEELPYDFFNLFHENMTAILQRNPRVERDATIINNGDILNDYTPYKDAQLLTDLLSLLNLIPYKALNQYNSIVKVSLADLAKLHHAGKINPDQQDLPSQVKTQIEFDNKQKTSQAHFDQVIAKIPQAIKREWIPTRYENSANWCYFLMLSQMIVHAFAKKPVVFGMSTMRGNALAYVILGNNNIYWNPINVEKDHNLSALLSIHKDQPLTFKMFRNAVISMSDTLSHECVHLSEGPCTGSHNRTFELKQRACLLYGLMKINTQALYDDYLKFYQNNMKDKHNPDAIRFMQLQLNCDVYTGAPQQPSLLSNTDHLDSLSIFRRSTYSTNNEPFSSDPSKFVTKNRYGF